MSDPKEKEAPATWVRVFIERFVLAILAPLVVLLAVTNPPTLKPNVSHSHHTPAQALPASFCSSSSRGTIDLLVPFL